MLKNMKYRKTSLTTNVLSRNPWIRIIFLLVGICLLTYVGILRGGDAANADMSYLYSAGVAWSKGLSPYGSNNFVDIIRPLLKGRAVEELIFAYPPWSAPLCMALTIFPFAQATIMMKIISLVSFAITSFFCIQLANSPKKISGENVETGAWYFIPALLAMATPTSTTLWLGQTSLIISAALLGTFYCSQRNKWLLSGVLLAIAAMKPQLSILVILWFILERRWKILGSMMISLLIFSIIPIHISGITHVFSDWLNVIHQYKSTTLNTEQGGTYVFTLRNLLFFLGINVPNLIPLGLLFTVLIWIKKVEFMNEDILPILLIISILCGTSHIYDLVILSPVVSSFYSHLQGKKIIMSLVCMAIISAPSRYLNGSHFLAIRISLLILVLGYLVLMSRHKATIVRTRLSSYAPNVP